MGMRVRGISVVGNMAVCAKKVGNQSGDAECQGRNLSIGVEITKKGTEMTTSKSGDKLK